MALKKMVSRKGFFFTFDALLASVILLGMLMLITRYYMSSHETTHISYLSQDLVSALNTLKVGEVQNSWIAGKISEGNITNLNYSITEQMGQFWAEGQAGLANELCEEMVQGLVEANFGYSILINGEEICGIDKENTQTVVSSRKMVSGIDKFKPVNGIVAQAHLTSIGSKKYSSYAYFGGFAGQGNISVFIDDIPSGAILQEMMIELDAGSDFELFINKNKCNGTFEAAEGNMTAEKFDISGCLGYLMTGEQNNFTLDFAGEISESYVGGGFIKAVYLTDQFVDGYGSNVKWLPGIVGVINLYDSLYVPGQLNNMSVRFHYYADFTNVTNNTLYLSIGNMKVLEIQNPNGEGTVMLSDANLTKYLNYGSLSLKTVPIRVGFENVTFGYIYIGQADVALITDVSGSMGWMMSSSTTGTKRNCDNPLMNDSTTERLSVAKCLDKEFSEDVLNITGNRIGLIAYSTSTQTSRTRYPTDNLALLYNTIGTSVPETGYTASGSTCICCGINNAVDMLMENITRTVIITNSSSGWFYTTEYLFDTPPIDISNNTWYNFSYLNETQWNSSGAAVIGSTNSYSYGPYVVTEIGSSLIGNASYADLWENSGDITGPPNDFTSGILNYTANTYGISGANDGWDWDTQNGAGPFGYDDNIDYNLITGGKLNFDSSTGFPAYNRCSGYDCSGAYGISVNITPQLYNIIQSQGGSAVVSFNYEWLDSSGNNFESSDQVWVKARWTSAISGGHYLGRNLDNGQYGADSDIEVATGDNPNNDFSGYFAGDVSEYIEGPGLYYLEIGGKLLSSYSDEVGIWRVDNIKIAITNSTNHYYFRKHFSITNMSKVQRAAINVLSDDRAIIYVNGQLIDEDFEGHDGEYWNRRGKNIPSGYLREGDNVLAVELTNDNLAAKLDVELLGFDNPRDKAITVMTDGAANVECSRQNTGDAAQDAILAACQAREKYGIKAYAVGFSDDAEEDTLESIAECGDGSYIKSNNITALKQFYEDVASSIVAASMHSQTIQLQGEMKDTILYGDSYIELNYTPVIEPPRFGEIAIITEQNHFQNCTFDVSIPEDIRVIEAKLTSYSAEHWTDGLIVNGNVIYNLSSYNPDYTELGDPFIVNIPSMMLNSGENNFYIRTGDYPENSTGCSLNNTFIYTGLIQSSVPYSSVLAEAEGCEWSVEFNDGSFEDINAPIGYTGDNECTFTSAGIDYNTNDTLQEAAYQLFEQLDFDDDYRVDVNFDDMNLFINSFLVPGVPSMWGPAIVEARIW
jgi:hypothetical protein